MRTFVGLFTVAVMGHVVLTALEDGLIRLLRWRRSARRAARAKKSTK